MAWNRHAIAQTQLRKHVASMAWGAQNLISTQVRAGFYRFSMDTPAIYRCRRLCGNRISGAPRCCLCSCVCSMAWNFQAIDATLSPWPRRLDGVEVHKGLT